MVHSTIPTAGLHAHLLAFQVEGIVQHDVFKNPKALVLLHVAGLRPGVLGFLGYIRMYSNVKGCLVPWILRSKAAT